MFFNATMFFNSTRRIKMNFTRIRNLAIGVGLVCLLPTGNALAGGGDLTKELDIDFAHEIATSSTDLNVASQIYTMGIDRTPPRISLFGIR